METQPPAFSNGGNKGSGNLLSRNQAKRPGLINQAALFQLRFCLKLLDKLGYSSAATHVSAAIDALEHEARSEEELSDEQIAQDEHVRMVLDMFATQSKIADDRKRANGGDHDQEGSEE